MAEIRTIWRYLRIMLYWQSKDETYRLSTEKCTKYTKKDTALPEMTRKAHIISLLGAIACMLSACVKNHASPACVENNGGELHSSGGCGQVFLYGLVDDSTAVTVWLDAAWYESLDAGCHSYSITHHAALRVEAVRVTPDADSMYFNYCNDVSFHNEGHHRSYPAVSGQVLFLRPAQMNGEGTPFTIDAQLDDLVFHLPEGVYRPHRLVWKDVWVGWFPG